MPKIERVTEENYGRFRDMVFWRESGAERAGVQEKAPEGVRRAFAQGLRVYAAEEEGRFVGWIALAYIPKVSRFFGPGYVYVDELWVQEGYRRCGIGSALLETADAWAEESGAVGVRLYVNAQNPAAKRLYEKHGFAGSGVACFMEKERARG